MSSVAAGKLRHRVQIEEFVESVNSYGERERYWAPFADRWASVEPLSGREFIAAQQAQSEVTTRITIRHLAGINAAMRIVHRGAIYNIRAILADKESGIDYQSLMCSEGTNDG